MVILRKSFLRAKAGGGLPPPPVPYTGTWLFYPYLTNPSAGELFLGLGDTWSPDPTKSGVYYTSDYGNNWTKVLGTADFGGYKPVSVGRTLNNKYIALVYRDGICHYRVYRASSLAGPWTDVTWDYGGGIYGWVTFPALWIPRGSGILGGDGLAVWVSGRQVYGGLNGFNGQVSSDEGATWNWSDAFGGSAPALVGQTRTKWDGSNYTQGFRGTVSTGANSRYTTTPLTGGAVWLTDGAPSHGFRCGVKWPYLVLAGDVDAFAAFFYSSNNGVSFPTSKAVPAGMQSPSGQGFTYGLDMSPSNENNILCVPMDWGVISGIWLSTDGGTNWTKVSTALTSGGSSEWPGVVFDRYDPSKAYAWGHQGFFRSDDGGLTWYARSKGLEQGQV